MLPPSRERGATAVEFAILLPVLLMLVLGIMEFGRAFHLQTTLSNAARDGVRVMALQDDATAARSTAKASAHGLTLTDAMISVSPTTCSSDAAAPGMASVTIRYPFAPVSGFLPLDDITLLGKGTMRCFG